MNTSKLPQMVPVGQLNDAPWNARKTFDGAAIQELAESIRAHGVLVPLIVRPVDDPATLDYEIVAGHRRFHAAQLAGLEEMPCVVREMDEDQAREIGLVDNLQRENVPAMEEAVAFAELLTRLKSIEAVAARLQKDQGYVAKRLKLCSLTLAGADALRHGLITVDHALVLARLGQDEQDAAVKWCLDRNAGAKVSVDKVIEDRVARWKRAQEEEKVASSWRHTWEPESVQRLRDHIACESGILLQRAPWGLADGGLLADVPACEVCPQNTKANAPLFGDLEIGEAKCTDGACFREKTQEFVRIKLREAERLTVGKADSLVLRVSWKATSTAPRLDKITGGPALMQIFKAGQWWLVEKKKCEHTRPAVAVDWHDDHQDLRKPGEILMVCVAPECKVHPKGWAEPNTASQSGPRNENSAEARAEHEKREALARDETRLRVRLAGEALSKLKALPDEALRALVGWAIDETFDDATEAVLPGFRKLAQTAKVGSVQFAQVAALMTISDLEASEWSSPEAGRKDFLASLKRLGYDASKAWEQPKATAIASKKSAKKPTKKKIVLSAAAKKRVVAAQKKRWATAKKAGRK